MGKRCKNCKVPLEGFMYKWVASKLFGIRPSSKDRDLCNKCDAGQGGRPGRPVMANEKEIGAITHYYGNLNVGIIELKGVLKVGDKIRIKGHTSDFTQGIASMQIEHATVSEGKAGDLVGIKVAEKVHPNDKVYKVT